MRTTRFLWKSAGKVFRKKGIEYLADWFLFPTPALRAFTPSIGNDDMLIAWPIRNNNHCFIGTTFSRVPL